MLKIFLVLVFQIITIIGIQTHTSNIKYLSNKTNLIRIYMLLIRKNKIKNIFIIAT